MENFERRKVDIGPGGSYIAKMQSRSDAGKIEAGRMSYERMDRSNTRLCLYIE